MGDILEEIGEETNKVLSGILTPNMTLDENKGHSDDADFIDKDPFFSHNEEEGIRIDDDNVCKRILYITLGEKSNIRLWDLMILIPTSIFLIFLIIRFNHARQKLRAANRPMLRAFYTLVSVSAVVSVGRCLLRMFIHFSTNMVTDEADKILWIFLRFILVATELSVLVFGLACGHLDSKAGIRRVILVTSVLSFACSITQTILELEYPDPNFHIAKLNIDLFGHGGMFFWFLCSGLFTLIYALVLLLPYLPCRHYVTLPHKRSFYYYAGFLMLLNGVQTIGSMLVYMGVSSGLCFVNLTTYLYFTAFAPIVYFTFLQGFFKMTQPTLLFSYTPQLDEFDADVPNASAMQIHNDDYNLHEESRTPIIINGQIPNDGNNESQGNLVNLGIVNPNNVVNQTLGN